MAHTPKRIVVDVVPRVQPQRSMTDKVAEAAGYLTFIAIVIFIVCVILRLGAFVLTL